MFENRVGCDEGDVLSVSPLVVVDNAGVGLQLVSNVGDYDLEYATPIHSGDINGAKFIKGVSARDDDIVSEWVLLKIEEFGPF